MKGMMKVNPGRTKHMVAKVHLFNKKDVATRQQKNLAVQRGFQAVIYPELRIVLSVEEQGRYCEEGKGGATGT